MKRVILFAISFCFSLLLNAQVLKTLNVTAGGLSSSLTATELSTVTNLTLTGIIDARDFKTMRDDMPLLAEIDLSGVTIVAYEGTEGTCPAAWGSRVFENNQIANFAFYNPGNSQSKNSLTSVVMPSTLISMGQSAFANCQNLQSVTLNEGLTILGGDAFQGCANLTTLYIPSSVTEIGAGTFFISPTATNVDANNQNYSSIDGVLYNKTQTTVIHCSNARAGAYIIPSSVTEIGHYAFIGCGALSSIELPAGLTQIGFNAFDACTGISVMNIPPLVSDIKEGAFLLNSGLINVHGDNLNYSSIDGVFYNKNQTVLFQCPISKTGDFVVPQTVTQLGNLAFYQCTHITSINIPSTVVSIGNSVMGYCYNLTSITVNRTIPVDLSSSEGVFEGINKATCTLYVPYGSKAAYQAANQWQDFTNIEEATNGFLLGATTKNFAATGGSDNISIQANVAWSASSDQTWLTVTPASGNGNNTLTLTADANPGSMARTATVTVSSTGIASQTVTVTQDGMPGETVTDIDGNVYHTVTIGTQMWTVENLKTTKYNDGTDIPNVTDNAEWEALTTGAYSWFNKDVYGSLYNWHAVNTGILAPTGWHVPTDAEWTTLTDFLTNNGYGYGGSGDDIPKSLAATSGWTANTTIGTPGNDQANNNSSGFTALPGGYIYYSGYFQDIGELGGWWGSTEFDAGFALTRCIGHGWSYVYSYNGSKQSGFSVRLVKGDNTTSAVIPTLNTTTASGITTTTANSGGNISTDGGAAVTTRGVCWSVNPNPTIAYSKTADGTGSGIFTSSITGLTANTTYYVRAYATNSAGTGYGNEETFTTTTIASGEPVTDIDGNVYNTVTIGTQTWTVENLKTTKYNDGTDIPNVTDNAEWVALTTGAYCWFNNDAGNKDVYGAFYNWHTVNTGKLAPAGWHVPTDAEWTTLTDFLTNNGFGYEGSGSDITKSMAATSGWVETTDAGTPGNDLASNNSSGFTALPGGYRYCYGGSFYGIGGYGLWWSSTEVGTSDAYDRYMYNSNNYLDSDSFNGTKENGFSVRLVKDENTVSAVIPTLNTTTASVITITTASSGGNVSSDGGAAVTTRGVCWSTSNNPTIADSKTADGTGSGIFTSSITDLTANTTYYVRAYATNSAGTGYGNEVTFTTTTVSETVTDIDGNVYNTVTIGTQIWTVENLKTTKYNDGTDIPNVTDNTEWAALTTGAYCLYNNDAGNKDVYGALYNGYTVNTGKLAPAGWHVPTDAERITLTTYLTNNGYGYEGSGDDIAKSMAATTGWNAATNAGTIGNDPASNNSSGFTALPGGNRNYYGTFNYVGVYGYWWSSTELGTSHAYDHALNYIGGNLYRDNDGKECGLSVRLVRMITQQVQLT